MIEFAVRVIGEDEQKGYWVLLADLERNRLLIAQDSGVLRWVNIKDCLLVKAMNPAAPRPMVVVQPPKQIVLDPSKFQGANGGRR